MAAPKTRGALQITIQGAVQGVGFRPFIYKLATTLSLTGWVQNSSEGVVIQIEGDRHLLDSFLERIELERPDRAIIDHLETRELPIQGHADFRILPSRGGAKRAVILPDLATCSQCLAEIFDPANRRYRYPFTNCTDCGPRYSIIEGIPYDRCSTSMKGFEMCPSCRAEYEDPLDRRFHAQPNACPKCGPQVELWDRMGNAVSTRHQAIEDCAEAIKTGKIIALKGLGGFQLLVNAGNQEAVKLLRRRKRRPDKPLAVMYKSIDLVAEHCHLSELERQILRSPQAPIVLLRQKVSSRKYFREITPNNPYLGVMLPYTPLHHLLLEPLDFPVVATSGNLSNEPICIDEGEALTRLGEVADLFLVHNRPILRPVDDSLARVVAGEGSILRRARGYAPLPIALSRKLPLAPILAVGGHLKNTVAIASDRQIFISQHLGDLETVAAHENFTAAIRDLQSLYEFKPRVIACDAHPNYTSTHYARHCGKERDLPVIPVQHHLAHVLACMAENQLQPPVLGVAWDGTGYGLDGTIWGGEFISLAENNWHRAAHWQYFPLPGGERAIAEPRRSALGILSAIDPELANLPDNLLQQFSAAELALIKKLLAQRINCPLTSSVGRLFDAVAAMLAISSKVSFEGQGAMELEFAAGEIETDSYYPFALETRSGTIVIDSIPLIESIIEDLNLSLSSPVIAAKFHNSLVEVIMAVAERLEVERVLLTGGCFQNKYLLEKTITRLRKAGFIPHWHRQIPPNDGGISLGQIVAVTSKFNIRLLLDLTPKN